MNLQQLRAFDAVVRTGSFTAAAERLHVTQPAVTSHVRALESYYEVSLFHRRGRRVEPTELGATLAEVSRRLFTVEEEATDLLLAHRALRAGRLRIAADGPYMVVPLVAAFRASYPGLTVAMTIANTAQVHAALIEERCDVAIQAEGGEDPLVHAVALASYDIVVFVGHDHEWASAGSDSIPVAALDARAVILREPGSTTRLIFEDACRSAGVTPEVVVETTSRETVKEAVAAGLGVGVISAAELRPDPRFRALGLRGARTRYTEQLLCLERRRNLRPVRAFLEITEEVKAAGLFPEGG